MPSSAIRRTKIVATLGPAWSHPARMAQLLDAGVNVVRVNASHGTPQLRAQWIRDLQEVRKGRRDPVAILVDLHGPRIRVGDLAEPRELTAGQKVTFAPEEGAAAGELPTTYAALAQDVKAGSKILLDDGLLSIEVSGVRGDRVDGVVRYGGLLRAHKGMNLPGVDVSAPAVTEKDREEVEHAVALGVDYIGVSFVRRAEDLTQLRALIPKRIQLVAKIEKDTALLHLASILDATDAVMVARGDLGVELPFEEVPLVQKRLIREANLRGKPVITATQMLESMVHAPRPTRAEASDVANAILDGTDAVMLSAETAVGEYAMEAVQAMDRIAREVERHRKGRSAAFDLAVGRRTGGAADRFAERKARSEDAIAVAVCAASELLDTRVIVCFTSSGFTARTVASFRPSVPIVAVTPEPDTHRALALVWGVTPVLVDHMPNYEAMLQVARAQLLAQGLVSQGDRVVVTAGVPFDVPGTTNLLKIETV
ncbi:MAG TPA: pyruvate kinase [Gemmatimonadales bacterium]|nr:pyruvate kinase [Gemmatimonadales bacterium]